jgi:transposase
LLGLYKKAREPKAIRAYNLLFLNSKGHAVSELAKLFELSENTVRACIQTYLDESRVGDGSRSGRPKKLDKSLEQRIVKLVDENKPSKHGFNVASWDCRELCLWLVQRGCTVSLETIRQILIKNGFHYVKTGYELARAEPKEQQAFIKRFKRLINAKSRRSVILFSDEMNNKLHPKQGKIWTREKKPTVPTHDSHKRIYTTGAVNPATGKLITRTSKLFNQFEFIAFLKKLRAKIKGRIKLFTDGHRSHKTPVVKEFLKKHPRLQLYFLPKYSPKLNPIEHLWGYIRQKRTNNIEFKNQRSLMKTIQHFLAGLPVETIQTVCSLNCILKPG